MPSGKSPKAKKAEKKPGLSSAARARARALRLEAGEAAKAGAPFRRPVAAAEGLEGGRRKKDGDLDPVSQRGTLEQGTAIELKADSLLPSDAFVRNDKVEIAVWYGLDIVGEALLRVVGLAAKGPEGPAYTVQPIRTTTRRAQTIIAEIPVDEDIIVHMCANELQPEKCTFAEPGATVLHASMVRKCVKKTDALNAEEAKGTPAGAGGMEGEGRRSRRRRDPAMEVVADAAARLGVPARGAAAGRGVPEEEGQQ